jgi:hypothetical protein
VADRWVGRDRVVDEVLDEASVWEVETGVHPERQNLGRDHDCVAAHVAEIHGAWNLAYDRHMRFRRAVEVEEDREPHARQQARLHALHQGEENDRDDRRHDHVVGECPAGVFGLQVRIGR